ncbi:MAG: hypothetical protein KC585_00445 [Candidatus Magasanikbacteria bacterium]|nr:hypothetical protein [Candidatus Magasanikbacteria bacterium]
MGERVHFSQGITNPFDQGKSDAANGLSMQDTSNREYAQGYGHSLFYNKTEMKRAGQAPAICLL